MLVPVLRRNQHFGKNRQGGGEELFFNYLAQFYQLHPSTNCIKEETELVKPL